MSISGNIRALRKKAGITQIDLAEKLGISIATLRRWEAGETAPTGTKITELANILNVNPEEIVKTERTESSFHSDLSRPAHNNGMIVFENNGVRIELPESEKGYQVLAELVKTFVNNSENKIKDN